MERVKKYYIHFFDDTEEEEFKMDEEVYRKIYSRFAQNEFVYKEVYLHEETEISYTLTIYKTDFFEIINDLIFNFIN